MLTQDCRSIVITFSFNSVFCQLASVDKYFDLAITFALSISKNKTNVIKCKNNRELVQWYSFWIQMKIKWFVLFPILSKIRIWPYNTLQSITSFQERHFWIIIHLWKGSLIIIVFLLFPISFFCLKNYYSLSSLSNKYYYKFLCHSLLAVKWVGKIHFWFTVAMTIHFSSILRWSIVRFSLVHDKNSKFNILFKNMWYQSDGISNYLISNTSASHILSYVLSEFILYDINYIHEAFRLRLYNRKWFCTQQSAIWQFRVIRKRGKLKQFLSHCFTIQYF